MITLNASEIDIWLEGFEEDQRATIEGEILDFPYVLYWFLLEDESRN